MSPGGNGKLAEQDAPALGKVKFDRNRPGTKYLLCKTRFRHTCRSSNGLIVERIAINAEIYLGEMEEIISTNTM